MLVITEDEAIEKHNSSLTSEIMEMSSKAYQGSTALDKNINDPNLKDSGKIKPKKRQEHKMTEEEREMNRKILKNMSKKLNFVKNPRFRNNNKCLLYSNNLFKDLLSVENPFVVEPIIVTFRDYHVNSIYGMELKLLNRTSLLTSFKYIPPLSENFSIKRVNYPKKDSSLIAPGMCAKIEILFNATSLDSFSDEITIIAETFAFKVPLRAIRDKPALSLDNPMDCKKSLIGDQVSMVFRCKNNGGDAHFKFLLKEQLLSMGMGMGSTNNSFSENPDQGLRSTNSNNYNGNSNATSNANFSNDNEVLEVGPFSIFPCEFYLYRGMMIEIFVNFSPKKEGIIEKNFVICCDSKNYLDYTIRGEGIMIDMALITIDGLQIDESETAEKLENLFFEETFPFTQSNRHLKILNKSSVSVKFHWNLYDYYAPNKFSIEEEKKYFEIETEEGVFGPLQELTFNIKFNPMNSKIYEKKIDLIIEDVPFQAIKRYNPLQALSTIRQKNLFTKGEPFVLAGNSPYPSYPIFSFDLKGKGKLPFLEVDNNYINFGDVYINQKIVKSFSIHNPKTGNINFNLTKVMQMIRFPKNMYRKISNFFKDEKNFIFESIFHAKKGEMSFAIILPGGNKNGKEIENSLNNNSNVNLNIQPSPDDKDNIDYEFVHYMKIFTSHDNLKKTKSNNINRLESIKKNNKNNSLNNSSRKKNGIDISKKITTPSKNSLASQNNRDKVFRTESINKELNLISNNTNTGNTGNTTNRKSSFTNNFTNQETEIEEQTGMVIHKDQMMKFNVVLYPTSLGEFKSSMVFTPEDGTPFSIDIKANVKGPKVKVDTPCLDFGLFEISEIKLIKFKIINYSPITANYLIKQSRFKNINFNNFIDEDYQSEVEGVITNKDVKFRKEIKTLNDYENRNVLSKDFKKLDLYEMKFSSVYGVIEPFGQVEIIASFVSSYPKFLQDTLEIMVQHSDSYFMNILADCQEAFAYLDMTVIEPKDIFVSVPIKFMNMKPSTFNQISNSNSNLNSSSNINKYSNKENKENNREKENIIRIVNPSNFPIKFKWEESFKIDLERINFSPNNGIVPPRSIRDIKMSSTYYKIREVDDLFCCLIDQMEVPLGVIIKGKVTGLDIKYEIVDDSAAKLLSNKSDNLSVSSMASTISRPRKRNTMQNDTSDKTLRSIDLKQIKVNKPYTFKFKIKNMSGIVTHYKIFCKKFQAFGQNRHDTDLSESLSSSIKRSRMTFKHLSIVSDRRLDIMNSIKTLNHFILNDAHEEINFTSTKGFEFTKMRQVEKDSVVYLSNKKGVAIIIDPNKGKLEPYSETIITVNIYNECVGDFEDELVCEIKGLPAKTFPIKLKIRGNPLQLSPFQPGFNYELDPPQLHLGHVLTKINKLEKVFKLLNTGSNTLSVDWKVFDYNDILYPKRDIVEVKIIENFRNNKFSLNFNALAPEELLEEKKCFDIFPKDCLINPKSTKDFLLIFKTDIQGINSALVVGYPKFVGETSNVPLSELAIKVNANGITPGLVIDKKKNLDDIFVFKFYYHSSGLSPTPKRSIILLNKEKINLIVKLEIEGPFKIIKTEPHEATIGNNQYNITPNSNLKLDVKFISPNVNDETEWPMTLLNEKHGKVKVVFENEEYAEYVLTAVLRRPRLKLYTTGNESIQGECFVHFGKVNCDNTRRHSLFITNETEVETKWSLNYVKFFAKKQYGHGTVTKDEKEDFEMIDDPDVFHFNISSGVIPGPSLPLINLPIGPALPEVRVQRNERFSPVKIEVMFKPKKNMFYKSRYRIIAETGNNIDFFLKGYGSYFEENI